MCTHIYKKMLIFVTFTFSFLNPNLSLYSHIPEGWLNYLKVVVLARGCPNHWCGGADTHMETRRPPPPCPPLPSASLPWNFEEGEIIQLTQDSSKVPNKSQDEMLCYVGFQMQGLTVPTKLKGLLSLRVPDANSFHKSS